MKQALYALGGAMASLALIAAFASAQGNATQTTSTQTHATRPLRRHQIHPRSFALTGQDYLAAEGGDLDGDGRDEIVLVRSGAVDVIRLVEHRRRIEALASQALPDNATPLFGRRVFAIARLQDARGVVRISDRTTEFTLTLSGGTLSLTERPPSCGVGGFRLEDACAITVEGRDYFASELRPLPGGTTPRPASGSFYSRRTRTFASTDSEPVRVTASINPRGRLSVEAGAHSASVLGAGAALAMGDIEGDGEPELLTSVSGDDGSPERLLLFRVRRRDGRITRLYRSGPLEGRLLVAGSGDLDGDGDDELFAIEERAEDARLWVLP